MKIEIAVDGSKAVIKLEGWLDTQTAPELGEAVAGLEDSVTDIVKKKEKLEYISSAGLRQIVAIYKKAKSLVICNVSNEIMDVFKMTGFDKRLNIQ